MAFFSVQRLTRKTNKFLNISEMVKIAVKARDTTDAACILLTVEVSFRNDGRGKAGYISSMSFERVGSYFFNS